MNQMQAGLPNQMGKKDGGWRLGDVKIFSYAAKLFFTDDDGTWLKTGVLSTWLSAYNPLLKNHKGLCMRDLPTPVGTTNFNTCKGANLYYVSGNYHMVGGAPSGSAKTVKYGATMAFGNDRSGDAPFADFSNIKCSMLMTGGNIVVGGSSTGTNRALAYSTNNASYLACSGPVSPNIHFDHLCANAAGTLGVAIENAAGSNQNKIWTTVNGQAFTQRTGSGGNVGTINAADWFPCASAFMFVVGTTTLNKTTDGFTQTAVTLPSLGSATFVTGDTFKGKFAHSATASLVMLSDGRLLRTTDGNTFTTVDVTNLEGYEWKTNAITPSRISHDGTRFVIYANNSLTGKPMFFYSENDGASFVCSTAYESIPDSSQYPVECYSLQKANSKLFIIGPSPSANEIGRSFDVTGEIGSTIQPTKVGVVVAQTTGSSGSIFHNKVA